MLEFIKKSPKYDFAEVWILDDDSKTKIPPRCRRALGRNYLKKLGQFDLVFRSPGVPFNLPEIQSAIKQGVIFSSATKLFFEHCSSRIIGVTGTKGKGTTSTLIYRLLKRGDFDAHLAGNMGVPMLDILPQLKQHSIAVLELSSFQLQDLAVSPQIAVVLSVFPDHLDAHATLKEYLDAKGNIARYQTSGNDVFFFKDGGYAARIGRLGSGKKHSVVTSGFDLFAPDGLKIPGAHNYKNAVMASRVAELLGCSREAIRETVLAYEGIEHRLESVREINGVRWYNDSASTNPQTMIAAAQSFAQPTIIIGGGSDKGLDYASVQFALKKSKTMLVILYGANRLKIKKALGRFPTVLCGTLAEAVGIAAGRAVRGSVVVLSPGAASFDQFHNYADRGTKFKEMIIKIAKKFTLLYTNNA